MKLITASEGYTYTPEGHDDSVTSRSIYKEDVDIHATTFPPHSGMAEEVHPDRSHVFYLLRGQMTVLQNGKIQFCMKPYDAVYIPAGEFHEIKNDTDEDLTFLAVTFPESHPVQAEELRRENRK